MKTFDWRFLPALSVGVLCALNPTVGETDEILGMAKCQRAAPGEPCAAAWDFTTRPHKSYWVEQFVYESSNPEWRPVTGPLSGHKGVTNETVASGFLYRVVGCDGKVRTDECVESTVFWVPVRPKSLEDIPETVQTPTGYYIRHKNLSALEQVVDYNVALTRRLVSSVDMKTMPRMTEPAVGDLRELWGEDELVVEDATIEVNVYLVYSRSTQR